MCAKKYRVRKCGITTNEGMKVINDNEEAFKKYNQQTKEQKHVNKEEAKI